MTALTTTKQKASYAIGMNWGTGLHRQGIDVDSAALIQGMKDALAGGKTLLTEDEARSALMQLQKDMQEKQQAKAAARGRGQQEGRRCVFGRQQDKGRRCNASQRLAIQDSEGRQRAQAGSYRQRGMQLQGHADQWHRV